MVIKMKKYKIYDILTIAGLLVTIYGFALATLILPDKDFSEDENRYLQQKPKFSISALTSGKLTSEIATYFSDQIPLRNVFVGTKAVVEIAMQKQENDDVLLGSDGYLIPKNDHPDYDRAGKNIKAINRFSETLITSSDSSLSVDMRVAIAGRPQDVLTRYIPAIYPAEHYTDRIFTDICGELAAPSIDLLTPLTARADAGEYVYYRTDHHWTTLGAY